MYFNGSEVKGETSDKDMKDKGAFELTSFELGAENNIDIGSLSSGGGAGNRRVEPGAEQGQLRGLVDSVLRAPTVSPEAWSALPAGQPCLLVNAAR